MVDQVGQERGGIDMKVAYLDCFSGISGDMFLGALIDAGLPLQDLKKALRGLPLKGLRIETRTEAKNHIHGTRFLVRVKKEEQVHRRFSDIKEIIRAANLQRAVRDKSIEIFEAIALEEGRIHHCQGDPACGPRFICSALPGAWVFLFKDDKPVAPDFL